MLEKRQNKIPNINQLALRKRWKNKRKKFNNQKNSKLNKINNKTNKKKQIVLVDFIIYKSNNNKFSYKKIKKIVIKLSFYLIFY